MRRLRGIIGVAVTWGVGLSALATSCLAVAVGTGIVPRLVFGLGEIAQVALRGFLVGAAIGVLFSGALITAERRRTLASLSTKHSAAWGFLAGACVPLPFAMAFGVLPLLSTPVLAAGTFGYGVIGMLLAAGTVGMARRAPALPSETVQPYPVLGTTTDVRGTRNLVP
ncbi:MAG: hypothetical protein V4550_04430 [Gemmatimonadota bacterium]